MAEEELKVNLSDGFYRDGIGKMFYIFFSFAVGIAIFLILLFYIFLNKPEPILFPVDDESRVQAAVPLDQPYVTTPELLQWISDVVPKSFVLDFINYNDQLKSSLPYYTSDGWKIFLNQLNIYANYNNVQKDKMFVDASPSGAPFILNQGLLSGRYAWWVQVPITITYASAAKQIPEKQLVLQVLVVRVSTLDNLSGMGIDNIIVATGAGK